MNQAGILAGALVLAGFVPAAAGQGYTETFTGGSNQGAWTIGNGFDTIEASGGNPGAYLHNPNIDTFAPQPRTGAGVTSIFTGDYRARNVQALGVDLITHSTQFNFARPLSLMLGNDNGTPGDAGDDCYVYVITADFVPQVVEGWKSFDVPVPSQSTTLPPGWEVQGNCSATPDAAWNAVITSVTNVRWFYGDPSNFFIFDLWNVGMDNASIVDGIGTPFCFGTPPLASCPCGNAGGDGEGCANSTGSGATLTAGGSTSVPADDLTFTASGLPRNALSILIQGDASIGPVPFGDGLRCVGGALKRLGVQAADASGNVTYGPGLAVVGGWTPFATRHFQVYYRNPNGPCGANFNISSGVSIAFDP